MAEYIERDAVKSKATYMHGFGQGKYVSVANIDKIPAADVVEVKRGQNLRDGGIFECSLCGWMDWDTMLADGPFNFCPNCGARMEVDHAAD